MPRGGGGGHGGGSHVGHHSSSHSRSGGSNSHGSSGNHTHYLPHGNGKYVIHETVSDKISVSFTACLLFVGIWLLILGTAWKVNPGTIYREPLEHEELSYNERYYLDEAGWIDEDVSIRVSMDSVGHGEDGDTGVRRLEKEEELW